ncbi:MAG: 30S ribosomal protein S12 methylthiotransferase RimO [Oligoflexales bacterium]
MTLIDSNETKKVHLISLGCARNRVDSEVMLGCMINDGYEITDDETSADVIVVNTCGFIGPAKEESINTILSAAELKAQNPDMKLVVAGCLTQRYKGQLAKGLPEVDLFIGTDEFPKLATYLKSDSDKKIYTQRTGYLYSGELPKKNTLAKASAYVKVAEGCQHNCSFCIIPAIRGKLRSRPIPSVVAEVEKLVSEGVLEVNLIAQDLAAYGREKGSDDLLPLLRALVKIDGLEWIRMLYVYPENISDEFLDFFANEPKLVKYLDIPIQHADNDVLKKMNRDVTREDLVNTIKNVRSRIPGIAIRTSVMVGFPGETEEQFETLKEFVQDMKLEHLGCFQYSKEENTVAGRMPNQIDEETKARRYAEIMTIQKDISRARLADLVGKQFPVLVDGPSEESELLFAGRLPFQAPEVDGIVYLNDGPVKAGSIQIAQIDEAHDYDLVAHILQ